MTIAKLVNMHNEQAEDIINQRDYIQKFCMALFTELQSAMMLLNKYRNVCEGTEEQPADFDPASSQEEIREIS